jgi:hypothetical protein
VARDRDARKIEEVNTIPHGQVWSVVYAAFPRWCLGEYEQAEALAAQALEHCEQYQLPYYAAINRIYLGVARSQLGRAGEGIALIRCGTLSCSNVGRT